MSSTQQEIHPKVVNKRIFIDSVHFYSVVFFYLDDVLKVHYAVLEKQFKVCLDTINIDINKQKKKKKKKREEKKKKEKLKKKKKKKKKKKLVKQYETVQAFV